jgi:hypothetical protein
MMIFMESIEPPPSVSLTDEEQLKVLLDAITNEDSWINDFIDRLAGVVRDMKH